MDIEKLIERMKNDANDYRKGKTLGRAFADQEDVLDNAATAISTLQAENEKRQAELEEMTQRNDENLGMCRIWEHRYTELQAENEKLRAELERLTVENEELKGQAMSEAMEGAISAGKLALMDRELEQVTRERDAAVDCINQIQSARDHTRPAYVVDKILSDWRGPEEG